MKFPGAGKRARGAQALSTVEATRLAPSSQPPGGAGLALGLGVEEYVSATAVNGARGAFCRRCGVPIEPLHGRRYCSDRCRLLEWAHRQSTPQRRIEFTPTASAVEGKRLGRRVAMLARLEYGPATTLDLMRIGGAGFSSRIHELREAGHRIVCTQYPHGAVYRLDLNQCEATGCTNSKADGARLCAPHCWEEPCQP